MTRISIASPQLLLMCGITYALSSSASFRIESMQSTVDGLIDHCTKEKPDVLVLDERLVRSKSLALLRRLRQCGVEAAVVMVSDWEVDVLTENPDSSEFLALLDVNDSPDEFLKGVRCAEAGIQFRSNRVAAKLKRLHLSSDEEADPVERLTRTELQVLVLLRQNLTSREIAEELFVSYRTVQKHRDNISRKLHLSGTNALLAYALQHAA